MWPFYPKDLLSNTYNLIHIHDTTTPYCSLVDPLDISKGLRSSTHNSKIQNSWMRYQNDVKLKTFSLGDLKQSRQWNFLN